MAVKTLNYWKRGEILGLILRSYIQTGLFQISYVFSWIKKLIGWPTHKTCLSPKYHISHLLTFCVHCNIYMRLWNSRNYIWTITWNVPSGVYVIDVILSLMGINKIFMNKLWIKIHWKMCTFYEVWILKLHILLACLL